MSMFTCRRCDLIEDTDTYQAFVKGFSDYLIKFDMSPNQFFTRFFGPEGNQRATSWVAYAAVDQPVGAVLGGTRLLDGIKTRRCGALCVDPAYRGSEIARELMALHESNAAVQGCGQLFLEVIQSNHRAVNFYNKLGYSIAGELTYFEITGQKIKELNLVQNGNIEIREISLDQAAAARAAFADVHVNWQNDIGTLQSLDCLHLGAFLDDELVGFLSALAGQIFLLWVHPAFRKRYIAAQLLKAMQARNAAEKYRITSPGNETLDAFCRHIGMQPLQIRQYEMSKKI